MVSIVPLFRNIRFPYLGADSQLPDKMNTHKDEHTLGKEHEMSGKWQQKLIIVHYEPYKPLFELVNEVEEGIADLNIAANWF